MCFGSSLRSVRYSDTYICYLASGAVLLATKFDASFKMFRNSLVLNIRSSNDTLAVDIDVKETVAKTDGDISKILTDYANHPNKEYLTFVIDGIYHLAPTVKNVKLGSSCCVIKDDSQQEVVTIKIPELKSYTYNDIQYYLVPITLDKNTSAIYSYRDASMWLMINDTGKRLAFEEANSIMQVTNNMVAVSADYLESVAAGLLWALDTMTLRITMRKGNPQPVYVNNDNYWRVINSFDVELRDRALAGTLSAPEVMQAKWQQGSAFNYLLDTSYSELTSIGLNEGYSVSTWDYWVNRPVVEASMYGSDLTGIVGGGNPQIPLVSYKEGYIDKHYPESVDATNDVIRIGYTKAFSVDNTRLIPLADIAVPVSFDVTHPEAPRLLVKDEDYIVIGNSRRINDNIGAVDTFDLATTMVYTATYNRRTLRLEGLNPQYANITVMFGKTTLVPFVDYMVHQEMLVFWGWQLPDTGEVTVVYQPSLVACGDCLEYGFIYDNRISIAGNYLAFDPSNYYILYDGKVIIPSEIEWENPFITSQANFKSGYPFAVMQPLLSNTDNADEMLERRTQYTETLDSISEFKDAHVPFPKPSYSVHEYRYKLVSIFMTEVIRSLLSGNIDYRPSTVASFGLSVLLKKELRILEAELDAIAHDLDWNVIEYRAHCEVEPMAINGDMYMFLEKVNKAYLKNRIQMNQNFRISE